jgi:hypothetical protein
MKHQTPRPVLIVTRSPISSISAVKRPPVEIPPENPRPLQDGDISKCIMCCCAFGALLGVLIKFG